MSELRRDRTAIYQMRARIQHLKPVVWRRFLVRSEASIEHLHQVICCLYGFDSSFPYTIKAAKVRYIVGFDKEGSLDADVPDAGGQNGQEGLVDEKAIPIRSLVGLVKGRKSYYDRDIFFFYEAPYNTKMIVRGEDAYLIFSDRQDVNWAVAISCEKVLPVKSGRAYPVCTEGERASPPRCFPNSNHYSAFVDNKKRLDKQTLIEGLKRNYEEDAADYIRLVDNDFDPGSFDLTAINQCLGRITQA